MFPVCLFWGKGVCVHFFSGSWCPFSEPEFLLAGKSASFMMKRECESEYGVSRRCSPSHGNCRRHPKHQSGGNPSLPHVLRALLRRCCLTEWECHSLKTKCSWCVAGGSSLGLKGWDSRRRPVSGFTVFLGFSGAVASLSTWWTFAPILQTSIFPLFCHWSGDFGTFISGCRLGKLGGFSFYNDLQKSFGISHQGELRLAQKLGYCLDFPLAQLTLLSLNFTPSAWMLGELGSRTWTDCSPSADQAQFVPCESRKTRLQDLISREHSACFCLGVQLIWDKSSYSV